MWRRYTYLPRQIPGEAAILEVSLPGEAESCASGLKIYLMDRGSPEFFRESGTVPVI
jgi:hypothetical protein